MMCGETPFKGKSIIETYQNIKNADLNFTSPKADPVGIDLVHQLLNKEPALRIGAHDINELKTHPYFDGIDWTNLYQTKVPFDSTPARRNRKKVSSSNAHNDRMRISRSFVGVIEDQSPLLVAESPCVSPSNRAGGNF